MICKYRDTESYDTHEVVVDPKHKDVQVDFGDHRSEQEIIQECVTLGVVPKRYADSAAINEARDIGEYYIGWGQNKFEDWPGWLVTFCEVK